MTRSTPRRSSPRHAKSTVRVSATGQVTSFRPAVPLEIASRRRGGPLGDEGGRQAAVALPEDHRILDATRAVVQGHDLEVDVEERRRSVEADEEARLADVLAGEGGEERPQGLRERASTVEDGPVRPGLDGDDEIEVAVAVHRLRDERAAAGDPDDAIVRPKALERGREEGGVGLGNHRHER